MHDDGKNRGLEPRFMLAGRGAQAPPFPGTECSVLSFRALFVDSIGAGSGFSSVFEMSDR